MPVMKTYKAGTTIFREGQFEERMYRIVSGTVGIYRDLNGEERKELTQLGEGRIFGELGVIDACCRTSSAEALTDVEVEVIENTEFSDYLEHHTEELFPVLDSICVRVRELSKDYDQLCQDLADYAMDECETMDDPIVRRLKGFAKLGRIFSKQK